MPKSPVATQKFVSDELFKYNTQIAQALNSILERFDKMEEKFDYFQKYTNQRFDKMDQRFDKMDQRFDKMDQRFDKMVTKTEMLGYKVELMDELKIIREELGANSSIDIRQNKEIEDHDQRLEVIETHLHLAAI